MHHGIVACNDDEEVIAILTTPRGLTPVDTPQDVATRGQNSSVAATDTTITSSMKTLHVGVEGPILVDQLQEIIKEALKG